MPSIDSHQACHIRWMIRRDMPSVLEIEDRSFEFPWTEDEFIRCLRQRDCIGMVAERSEQVVGFMIYELHKNRIHILSFAVHPDFRRNGIGSAMVDKLITKLAYQRRNRIMLEVRETNLDAQLFSDSSVSGPPGFCVPFTKTPPKMRFSCSTGNPPRRCNRSTGLLSGGPVSPRNSPCTQEFQRG